MATYVTGYIVDIINTPTHISSTGYTYLISGTVYLGSNYCNTSSNGFFTVAQTDPPATTIITVYPKYETVELVSTSSMTIGVWKNKGYV